MKSISEAFLKAFNAACTPDFYVFNRELNLVYHGQLDDSRPGNSIPVSGNSLRETLTCLFFFFLVFEFAFFFFLIAMWTVN